MKSSTRPLSPHIQVYKMPLSAKLSILHRLTGLTLSLAAVLLVYWLFSLAYLSDNAIFLQSFFSSTFGMIVLMVFTFSFVYHFLNGIRHLVWDIGKGLELESVNKSGIIVIILSVVLTALIWFLGVK
jgi:succinate dehydrogenase / fumarate reductase cytochrome b subunit